MCQSQICSSQNVGVSKTCNFGDDDDDDMLMRFSRLREDELKEMLSRIPLDMRRKFDRWIRIVINAERQKLLSQIKEKYGLDLPSSMAWNFDYTASTSGSQPWQLQFSNGISAPIFTGMAIEGEDSKSLIVALVDATGKTVSTGPGAAATVEIVVLEGDCNDHEAENWSSDEFNNKIIHDWNGMKVLQGNTFLNLKGGIGSIDKISFTHNKTWKNKRNCRLGARPVNAVFAKEAKTESFLVRDKRKRYDEKHHIPSLDDDVWRLYKIGKKGTLTKSLTQAKIRTVGDFIERLFLNRQCLEEIFDRPKHAKSLETAVKHALTCPDKLKYCSSYEQKPEVVFNLSGEVFGLYLHGQFLSRNIFSETQKQEDAKKLVISAFKNWGDVVPVDEDQFVADCSNPAVHGLAKTEIVTPCINTQATTCDKSISWDGVDLVINESSLFGNTLSDEQHLDPQFLSESLRQRKKEERIMKKKNPAPTVPSFKEFGELANLVHCAAVNAQGTTRYSKLGNLSCVKLDDFDLLELQMNIKPLYSIRFKLVKPFSSLFPSLWNRFILQAKLNIKIASN
ncbi:hypothetical protein L6452_33775 [Arctium lappa]|uniref:Uncharacterized protein n=1 Tax=Arctium lappa TaxID=4217 RepID=A0ACB8YHI4_ARCLA|nr:hypothetical protein L6452_33775 [Arctium lappa]